MAHGAVGVIDFLDVIFISHTLLETWLGLIKLRGRYQHEATNKPVRSAAYTRHHGASILALALLSHLVYSRGLVRSPTGQLASAVLATFHGGAVASFTHAWLSGGELPFIKILTTSACSGRTPVTNSRASTGRVCLTCPWKILAAGSANMSESIDTRPCTPSHE